MDIVIKNPYFKLLGNNITLSRYEKFFLEKIKRNTKVDALFLYSLIRKASDVKKVNAINSDKNMSATTLLVTNNKEDRQFQFSQRESKRGKNNTANKFNSNEDSSESCNSSDSNSDLDVIRKSYHNCHWNKAFIAIISFCMMAYTRNKYINLLQIVTGYFSFAHNVSKRGTEV